MGEPSGKTKRLVWISSWNRCALPDCRRELVETAGGSTHDVVLGDLVHIAGNNPGSARFDPEMSESDRNSADNLFVACANCHKKIDGDPETYTVNKLRKIKREHGEWMAKATQERMHDVSFTELDSIMKYLAENERGEEPSYVLTHIREKINKNRLSPHTRQLILNGTSQVKQVGSFIDKHPDARFGERLTAGFVRQYEAESGNGLAGDELFEAMWQFACQNHHDFLYKAAGLAVLVYLFEKCEVFEK